MPNDYSREELLALVVDEVDDARDVYQLAEQLAPHLPIKSLDELVRATDGRQLRFRDAPFEVESVRPQLPGIAFPVEDLAGLVEKLGLLVRIVPPSLGVDFDGPDAARRQLHRDGGIAPGLLSPATRSITAMALPGGPPPELGQLLAQPPTS